MTAIRKILPFLLGMVPVLVLNYMIFKDWVRKPEDILRESRESDIRQRREDESRTRRANDYVLRSFGERPIEGRTVCRIVTPWCYVYTEAETTYEVLCNVRGCAATRTR